MGTAVAELLRRRGHTVTGVASRSVGSAASAATLLDSRTFDVNSGPSAEPDVVLIGTSDNAIEWAATRIASWIPRGAVACHFAGVFGIAPLHAVVRAGGRACALHPVQTCPDVATAIERLPGSAWGVTCSDGLSEWADEIIAYDLDGLPVEVIEKDRALWHAAAVTTANGIAALLAEAEAILGKIGVESPTAVLGPLAAGAIANARQGGGGGATLTGPVVRGEATTLSRHLTALRDRAPDLLEGYKLVVRMILAGALRSKRIDVATRDRVEEVLKKA